MADTDPNTNAHASEDTAFDPEVTEMSTDIAGTEGADVALTEHAPGKRATGPEQRGTGGSG